MMRSTSLRIALPVLAALWLAAGSAEAQGRGNAGKTPPGQARQGGLPPGQAKKYRTDDGVLVLRDVFGQHGYVITRIVPDGQVRHVFYKSRDGRVRRAVVRPGTERLVFEAVPALLLRQIVARLY